MGVHGKVVPVAVEGGEAFFGVADDFLEADVAAVEVGAEIGGAGEVRGECDGEVEGVTAVADEVLVEGWMLFNIHGFCDRWLFASRRVWWGVGVLVTSAFAGKMMDAVQLVS